MGMVSWKVIWVGVFFLLEGVCIGINSVKFVEKISLDGKCK